MTPAETLADERHEPLYKQSLTAEKKPQTQRKLLKIPVPAGPCLKVSETTSGQAALAGDLVMKEVRSSTTDAAGRKAAEAWVSQNLNSLTTTLAKGKERGAVIEIPVEIAATEGGR